MAAESAAFSNAIDKHLYCRPLFQVLLYGEEGLLDGDWKKKPIVEGILVTDARSLYDHIHSTGSLPAERSVMLDLPAAKKGLTEKGMIKLRGCLTPVPLANHLTKPMTSEFLEPLPRHGQAEFDADYGAASTGAAGGKAARGAETEMQDEDKGCQNSKHECAPRVLKTPD